MIKLDFWRADWLLGIAVALVVLGLSGPPRLAQVGELLTEAEQTVQHAPTAVSVG